MHFLPTDSGLQPEGLHPARGVAPSGFRPLRKILDCSTRRCLGGVSVPVRRVMLSHPLPIEALVGYYPTNKLVGRRPIPRRNHTFGPETLSGITGSFPPLSRIQG